MKVGNSYRAPVRSGGMDGGREVTINTTAEDRHGTIIDPAGAELENYRKNPVVLLNHNPEQIVGTSSVRLSDDRRRLIATMQRWAESAGSVRRKVENGILKAASVGFRVIEKERAKNPKGESVLIVTRWELVEWSWVAVPSNPTALARSGQVQKLPEHAVRQLRGAQGRQRKPSKKRGSRPTPALVDVRRRRKPWEKRRSTFTFKMKDTSSVPKTYGHPSEK
jgi:HK97 family phage prohead protease